MPDCGSEAACSLSSVLQGFITTREGKGHEMPRTSRKGWLPMEKGAEEVALSRIQFDVGLKQSNEAQNS